MSNVQQPEMRRSGHDPLVADSAKERVARGAPGGAAPRKDLRSPEQRSTHGPEGADREADEERIRQDAEIRASEPDFAEEHGTPSIADQMRGGPERKPDPETPEGYAGMDE